jgi:hypothetical protein
MNSQQQNRKDRLRGLTRCEPTKVGFAQALPRFQSPGNAPDKNFKVLFY